MFKLEDGRETLWQWDIERKLIVNDPSICEVHFCNRTTDCSLVVKVENGQAAIPNILLQDARPIRVYAFCDDQYTKTEQQFTVKSRTKPEDYVYDETETLRYSTLDKKITELEQNIPVIVAEEVNKQPVNAVTLTVGDYTEHEWRELNLEEETAFLQLKKSIEENKYPAVTLSYIDGYVDTVDGYEFEMGGTPSEVSLAKLTLHVNGTFAYDFKFHKGANKDGEWVWGHSLETTESYVTETYVDNAINNIDIPEPDLSGYATEEWVTQAIADSAQGETDLSNYYTKDEVNALFEGIATAEGGSY